MEKKSHPPCNFQISDRIRFTLSDLWHITSGVSLHASNANIAWRLPSRINLQEKIIAILGYMVPNVFIPDSLSWVKMTMRGEFNIKIIQQVEKE